MRQNEYLFRKAVVRTTFGPIYSKMECILVLNAVCFGAECSVFWCKTQGKMVLNAVQNGAIRESIRINIPYNGIIKTF